MCGGHLRKTPLENARLSAIGVSAIDALVADLDTDFFTIVSFFYASCFMIAFLPRLVFPVMHNVASQFFLQLIFSKDASVSNNLANGWGFLCV